MKIKGFIALIVALLFVVTVAWIGITVYDSVNNVEVNPNSDSVRKYIEPNFDTEGLFSVDERVGSLGVEPEVFHKLEDDGIATVDTNSDSSTEESDE